MLSIGTGNVSVTGSVTTSVASLGFVKGSATQTIRTATLANQTLGAKTLFTVTAGKTFYCLGISVSSGAAGRVAIQVAGTPVWTVDVIIGGNNSVSGSGVIFTAAATQNVELNGQVSGASGTVWGYEE